MIFSKKKSEKNYKFNSLDVYAWDRSVGGKKKFRRLFENSELDYIGAELSFYNKLFDESNWKVEILLIANKLINNDKQEKICEKNDTVTVNKEDNIFKYSFGWGSDKRGDYWDKGVYEWEVYIDGEFVSSTKFYVEDEGKFKTNNDNYLTVKSLNTYEAPDGDLDAGDRVFLKSFKVDTTRYIMSELRFVNMVAHEWHCELFFNIYDDTGMLIGSSDSFLLLTPSKDTDEIFTVTAGWGRAEAGLWIKDNYTMEVTFMDEVIAIIPFSISDKNVERISEYEALLNEDVGSIYDDTINIKESNAEQGDNSSKTKSKTYDDDSVEVFVDDKSVDEILADLDALIGLENIKKKVREYIDYVSFLQFREESGIKDDDKVVMHSVFTGNPGTGKTTVVKLLGEIYKSMGLLSKGHVHTVEANDIIAGFIRQTGKDTKKAIEKARGGILFVDEAYMLFKEGNTGNDFGSEAVAALITEMSDGKGDIAIMVAGYPKEMESFINSNPGLKSRFRNYFHFEDYTPDELSRIAEFAADKKGVKISKDAAIELKKVLMEGFRKRDRTFGNARFAFALIDEAKINMGARVMKDPNLDSLTKAQISTLLDVDIEDVSNPNIDKKLNIGIDEELLKEALGELDELTGLASIKQEVTELIKLSRYYKEIDRDILKAFSMHGVFIGNPGTGKTTVARTIAKVYKALGMLERGHIIDADGSDLVGQYVGQTAIKTKDIIEKAMGGILFIDEAYSITEGNKGTNSNFGGEAIATLIKVMEDRRSEFGVIVAGYTQNMERFLEANPGLKSRFDRTFHFEDFTIDELWEITVNMYKSNGLVADAEAETHLKTYIKFLYDNRDRFFGNARSIRKIIEKSTRNHELRMAGLSKKQRTKKMMLTVNIDDVREFDSNKVKTMNQQTLGFKFGG